ncbi:MAG: ABC transporter ATP-binding protein [Bacteroidota bacterium]|nr:ABC transporter ATP-binding protein [Bacteroidota bacterium]
MKKIFDLENFIKSLKFVNPYLWSVYFTIFSSILFSIFSAARPVLIQLAFDIYIAPPSNNHNAVTSFFVDNFSISFSSFMLIIFLFLFLEAFIQFFFIYKSNFIAQLVIKDIRNDLFNKILNFKVAYFDNTPIGKVITRVISDIEAVGLMFSQGILSIFGDLFKILIIVTWMFFSNWKLAIVSLSFFPFLIFSTIVFQKYMKKTFERIRAEISKLNVFVYEHILGIHIVKIFNQQKREDEKFKNINKDYTNYNIKSVLYFSIFLPVIDIFSAISMGLIVWYGGFMIFSNNSDFSQFNTSLGQLISFILLVNMLFRPLRSMADKFNTLQMGTVAFSRVFKLINSKNKLEKETGDKNELFYSQHIKFNKVSFSYKKDELVLNNINLQIDSGKSLAIVGPTGSGKTTLINLITRFYELKHGDIFIGDASIKNLDVSILRKNIGLILQDTFLFSDTIFKNITFFTKKTKKEINFILDKMGLLDFINSFPNGLDYNIGEGGIYLSNGQKQLISFIRTYISFSPIIIFDEATSSLDSETEELVKKSIRLLIKNKTSIIIAHRLSTIKNVDKIIFLKDGEITEQGTHEELILKKGFYWKYYKTQLV